MPSFFFFKPGMLHEFVRHPCVGGHAKSSPYHSNFNIYAAKISTQCHVV